MYSYSPTPTPPHPHLTPTPLHYFLSDVDECMELNGGCHQICINTEGSFNCSCNEGFELQSDMITCQGKPHLPFPLPETGQHSHILNIYLVLPTNECDNETNCTQNCVRDIETGLENCSCNLGYVLNSDGFSCDGKLDIKYKLIPSITTIIIIL